jgi:hypothetical protein
MNFFAGPSPALLLDGKAWYVIPLQYADRVMQ